MKGEREDGGEAQEVEVVDDDGVAMERVIAVDWTLNKERWEEEKAKIEREQEADDDVEMQDVSAKGDDDNESEEDEENLVVHEEGSDGFNGSVDGNEDVEEPVPLPETRTTLFVRNLPFNGTDDKLIYCMFFVPSLNASTYWFAFAGSVLSVMHESPLTMLLGVHVERTLPVSGTWRMQTRSLCRASCSRSKRRERQLYVRAFSESNLILLTLTTADQEESIFDAFDTHI